MTRRAPRSSIYLDEADIARELGMTSGEWRVTATILEKDGMPRRNPMFSNRRHWPSVQAFLQNWEMAPRRQPQHEAHADDNKGFGAKRRPKS